MKTRMILLKGHAGNGKTTLGRALAQQIGLPVLTKDDFEDDLVLSKHPEANALAYQLLWQAADHELEFGDGVIVDSPLSLAAEFECARDLAIAHSAPYLVVECRPSDEVWRKRLEDRRSEPEAHRISSWAQMQDLLHRYDDCHLYPIPQDKLLPVDTGALLDTTVERILDRLGV